MKHLFKFALLLLLIGSTAACSREFDNCETQFSGELRFSLLNVADYENADEYTDATRTSGSGAVIEFDTVAYIFTTSNGDILDWDGHKYMPASGQIIIEGIPAGDYTLSILASDGPLYLDNVRFNDVQNSRDEWFEVTSEKIAPFNNQYFFASFDFSVVGDQIVTRGGSPTRSSDIISGEVTLSRIFGRQLYEINYGGYYVEKVTSAVVIDAPGINFYSAMNAAGTNMGSKELVEASILDCTDFYMPITIGAAADWSVRHDTVSPSEERLSTKYRFETSVEANRLSSVTVVIDHPYQEQEDYLYFKAEDAASLYSEILTDDEPLATYSDSSQRSFRVNNPLQMSLNSSNKSVTMTFYSAVPIENVALMAKVNGSAYRYELLCLESVPAFGHCTIPLDRGQGVRRYRAEDGSYAEFDIADCTISDVTYATQDEYMKKIETILPTWLVYWPNTSNGSVWLVPLPVHVRESVALFTNVAYMLSLEDFQTKALEFEGHIYDDNGNLVNVSQQIQNFIKRSSYDFRIVNTSSGAVGMATIGGNTIGVTQSILFNSYTAIYSALCIFHEFGHTLGYDHASGMTYGLWAQNDFNSNGYYVKGLCNNYYYDNISTFPVNSKEYLNSWNNPNRY